MSPPWKTFIQSVSVQLTAILPVAILMYILGMLFTCCFWSRVHSNPKNRRRTNLGSHIWSRRRILWRHARVSRVSYIALALKSRCCDNLQSKSQKRNEKMLTKPYSDIMNRNGHAVIGAQIDGEVQDGNELMLSRKKTRFSSSKGDKPSKKRERTSHKIPFFFIKPRRKRVKKQRGRRRAGRPIESSTVYGHAGSKRVSIASTVSRRKKKKKKKKCSVITQAVRQQPSVPAITKLQPQVIT